MDKQKLWSITKLFLKIAVTAFTLYLVFTKVKFSDLKEAFYDANLVFLVIAFICFLVSQLISSSRLNNFFRGIGLHISDRYNFKIFLLGMFYNLFLPGGIGGDGYKIFLLRKKMEIKGRRLFQAVFFDRLSGFWALILILSCLIYFIPKFGIPNWLPIVIVAFGSVFYYFIMRRYFKDYSHNFVITHIKAILVQSMQIITVIFLLYTLNFDGKFAPYLFMFLVSSLVAIFPFTVGGLGAREVVFIYGAEMFGIDQHIAVLVSLMFYCISASLSFSGIYFVFNPQALGVKKIESTDL